MTKYRDMSSSGLNELNLKGVSDEKTDYHGNRRVFAGVSCLAEGGRAVGIRRKLKEKLFKVQGWMF